MEKSSRKSDRIESIEFNWKLNLTKIFDHHHHHADNEDKIEKDRMKSKQSKTEIVEPNDKVKLEINLFSKNLIENVSCAKDLARKELEELEQLMRERAILMAQLKSSESEDKEQDKKVVERKVKSKKKTNRNQ
ncbi:hypothetical protein QR98_0062110 [Sarcoptes scabiei]|uniref:Uncharacterized protein n=1 Tax=Sarcoptes scabiei TaxID=52283 RepID=A0A132A9T3_SARSC|nr:hypothetical protein QR98_0062110 [Sarcoptes scabiei]